MFNELYQLIGVLAFVLVLVSLLPLLVRQILKPKSAYQLRECLLTPAERNFFGVLQQAFGGQYILAMKVRMSDVVGVKGGLGNKDRQSAWNKISQKHFDFVLCAPDTSAVLAIIELDDRSHRTRDKTKDSDRFKDACLREVGLPIIRFAVQPAYNIAEVRQKVLTAVGQVGITESPVKPDTCPRCGAPLITRTAKSGPLLGKSFMGCSRFPDCRYTGPLTGI